MNHQHTFKKVVMPLALAFSITISSIPIPALAGPGDVNSVNNGQVVQGGTYYNTPGAKTTFQNTTGSGLWLKQGSTVRGLESDPLGNPNGNGGWLHFNAPGSVVRLDGNVNVNALMNGKGMFLGNGGRVTIDSAFLYQNGNIMANGVNGGMVQFNVGSAMFGPNARIEAKGFGNGYGYGGYGGQISVNSPGVIDIQRGAVMDTSGRVIGTYDTNIINIEGGLINMQGVLRADGAIIDGQGSRGGTVRLVATGMSDVECVNCAVSKVTDVTLTEVTLDSEGEDYDNQSASLESSGNMFTDGDRSEILSRQNQLVNDMDGDIRIGGEVSEPMPYPYPGDGDGDYDEYTPMPTAFSEVPEVEEGGIVSANGTNGTMEEPYGDGDGDYEPMVFGDGDGDGDGDYARSIDGRDGGTILFAAADDIENNGSVTANAGHGVAGYESAGHGGDGGTISFTAGDDIVNNALIAANGGNGASSYDHDVDYGESYTNEDGLHAEAHAGPKPRRRKSGDGDGDGDYDEQGYMDGGHGGEGGVIAFSYGGDMENNGEHRGDVGLDSGPGTHGVIQANGGDGGNGANATARAIANNKGEGLDDVSASASATGGDGGHGGNGGLIVFAGMDNPTGHGSVEAIGGDGGRGGDATARAIAKSDYTEVSGDIGGNGDVTADALANAGHGGYAGESGLIVAPNPENFGDHQYYQSTSGIRGADGTATAIARATGGTQDPNQIRSSATANTGYHGEAIANSRATISSSRSDGDAFSTATANSGDYGSSKATSNANSHNDEGDNFGDHATSTANATSGEHGFADAHSKASARRNASSTANAVTGDSGHSHAVSRAFGIDGGGSSTDATSLAAAVTGEYGTALANSKAVSEKKGAKSTATTVSGDDGYSRSISNAEAGETNGISDSTATSDSGRRGYAESRSAGISKDDVRVTSDAEAGRDGTALAFGTADAGSSSSDDVFSLTVAARTGRDGDSKAKGTAIAGNDIDEANVTAHSGKNGRSWASLDSTANDDVKNTHVLAKTGENGEAFASNTANAGDDIENMSSKAEAGKNGTAVAVGDANAGHDIGEYDEGDIEIRGLDVVAKAGRNGEAKALGIAKATNDDVEHLNVSAKAGRGGYAQAEGRVDANSDADRIDVKAETGRNGTALAHADVKANDLIDEINAQATTGKNGRSEAYIKARAGSGSSDDVYDAIAIARTGDNGTAIAVSDAEGGDDVDARAEAHSGDNGFSSAESSAVSTKTSGGGDADSTAIATTGEDGSARSHAFGSSNSDDVNVTSHATVYGEDGLAKASHSARADDRITFDTSITVDGTTSNHPSNGDFYPEDGGITFGGSIANGDVALGTLSDLMEHPKIGMAKRRKAPKFEPVWPEHRYGNDVDQLQSTELILHNENAILLSTDIYDEKVLKIRTLDGLSMFGGGPTMYLSDMLANANVRTLDNKLGSHDWIGHSYGGPYGGYSHFNYDASDFTNFVIGNTRPMTLVMDQPILSDGYMMTPLAGPNAVGSHSYPMMYQENRFDNLNTLTVVSQGDLVNPSDNEGGYNIPAFEAMPTTFPGSGPMHRPVIGGWEVGLNRYSEGRPYNSAGGHTSLIALGGSIVNNNLMRTYGEQSGGSINMKATGTGFGGRYFTGGAGQALYASGLFNDYYGEGPGFFEFLAGMAPDGIYNFDTIATSGRAPMMDNYNVQMLDGPYKHRHRRATGLHGGSVLLRGSNILNLGKIAANGRVAGGKVQLVASEMPLDKYTSYQLHHLMEEYSEEGGDGGLLFGLFDTEQWTGMPWTGHIVNLGKISASAKGRFRMPESKSSEPTSFMMDEYNDYEEDGPEYSEKLTPFGQAFDPHSTGGTVLMKAGGVNLNFGKVKADGKTKNGIGYGGFVRQHANGIAANFGTLQANGNQNGYGGTVLLTAGDKDHSNDSFNMFGLPDVSLTSSFFGLPTGVNLTRREAGYNFGTINAQGGVQDGIAILAGNNQFYQGGEINAARTLLFVGQDIGGLTAVELAACVKIPDEVTDEGGPDINPDLLGLFQEDRFVPTTSLNNLPYKLQLAFDNPELFLASNYLPVTEEILALAFEAYEQERLAGKSEENAMKTVEEYLRQVGIDPEVAQSLIDRIDQGLISSTDKIVEVLQTIADGGEGSPDGLVQ